MEMEGQFFIYSVTFYNIFTVDIMKLETKTEVCKNDFQEAVFMTLLDNHHFEDDSYTLTFHTAAN
jgi:hypothetical protein